MKTATLNHAPSPAKHKPARRQNFSVRCCCALLSALLISFAAARPPINANNFMVSAANPHAVRAGLAILEKGGSAMDAAVAVQMVLNVVEPQSSGIGGGAFLLYWDATVGKLHTYDGRETAPAAVGDDLFMENGNKMKWRAAVVGGRSVGVPGVLAMLDMAHKKHGNLSWQDLFAPAIALAENGFAVSPRLSSSIAREAKVGGLGKYAAAKNYFFTTDGNPLPAGANLINKPLAKTFRAIARGGAAAFYSGRIANDIVSTVVNAADNRGKLSATDLANYRAKPRPPLCMPYRDYRVCGMGPPTSGGITVLQILKMLESFDLAKLPPLSAEASHLFSQAAKLAYADRAVHIADADFYAVPVQKLMDETYLRTRAKRINRTHDLGKAKSGIVAEVVAAKSATLPSTTHFSIVDKKGNAASMTSSIENAFGSTLMSGGFLLNNQLTDFSFAARDKDGRHIANRVQPGKRPRSSMSPIIVFDKNGAPFLVIGSPGGSRIINYVARAIVAVIDWRLDAQSAVSLPHVVNRNGATDLEEGTAAEALKAALQSRGHQINVRKLVSGLHAIIIKNGKRQGGADPRREGIAAGR